MRRKTLNIPVFIAAPMDDTIVDTQHTLDFFKSNTNPNSAMVIYARNTFNPKDERVKVRMASIPSQQILNLSHVGITSSPNNPIYGRNGSVKSCSHYKENPELLKKCKTAPSSSVFFGEKNMIQENDKRIIRRITFNPYFKEMLMGINEFIASIIGS